MAFNGATGSRNTDNATDGMQPSNWNNWLCGVQLGATICRIEQMQYGG